MVKSTLEFKKLDLRDRDILERYTKKFPPYNDFDFVSLWAYNIDGNNAAFTLHENLVIKIQDFVTGNFFYSFLGTNKVKETVETLIEKSKKDELGGVLRLVPESNIKASDKLDEYFTIEEDPDSFDYIFSIDEVVALKGNRFKKKKNLIHTFNKLYPDHTVYSLNFNKKKTKADMEYLFHYWEYQKGKNYTKKNIESIAFEKFLDFAGMNSIIGLGIECDNKLIGFITYHLVHSNYAIISFQKGDVSYKGIYEYLLHKTALHLKELGMLYINHEQDLGIPGLKKAKMLWRPVHFLKKYTIKEK